MELDAWVINELFVQISYNLHHQYQELGGDDEDSWRHSFFLPNMRSKPAFVEIPRYLRASVR
jgi:hypothetical protein